MTGHRRAATVGGGRGWTAGDPAHGIGFVAGRSGIKTEGALRLDTKRGGDRFAQHSVTMS